MLLRWLAGGPCCRETSIAANVYTYSFGHLDGNCFAHSQPISNAIDNLNSNPHYANSNANPNAYTIYDTHCDPNCDFDNASLPAANRAFASHADLYGTSLPNGNEHS